MDDNIIYKFGFKVKNLELKKRIGMLLYIAGSLYEGFELKESDVQWIEKNIVLHPLFRIINDERCREPKYAEVFYQQFLDMPGIPVAVNRLLFITIGYLGGLHIKNCKSKGVKNIKEQICMCELWMKKVQAWR